ncbi:MAG TPA: tail fiber domain-containing protein [Panacibacter sp.]|nr:tail fiber domain-containing protein [Panacibacter sp.]
MKTKFTCIVIIAIILSIAVNAQTDWLITGNSNITTDNFIGTTNKTAFKIRTNNIVRMTITSAGNTGIGTTAPKTKLDVAGGITAYSSYFTRLDGAPGVSVGRSGANYGAVGYGLTFTDTTDRYRYNINDFSSMLSFRAGGFDFNTATSGAAGNTIPYTTAMAILQNGNVGIGTLTPSNKFTVAGNADFTGNVGIGTTNSASYKLYVLSNTLNYPAAYIENSHGTLGSEGLHIKAGSNLATGSNFIAFYRPSGTPVGGIQQTSVNGITYLTSSDKRLKNIIGASQKGLADLMRIKIYDYTFKSDQKKQVLTGFMAQELYEIFPQAVSKPGNNNEPADKNPWMVDYGRVTPLIIKSVQEQQQMIDELKKQNEKLQKQIDDLKAMMISKKNESTANNQTALK